MKKFITALLTVLTIFIVAACGGSSHHNPQVPKVYPHSKTFLNQVQNVTVPKSKLLTATAGIPGYDAVDSSSIPSNAQAAGCYNGPGYYTCVAAHRQAPNARLVRIAQNTGANGKILDVEPGDASPSQAGGWIRKQLSLGQERPGIYASLSWMPQVRAALGGLTHCTPTSTSRTCYVLWVAAWDGSPSIISGYDAIQWHGNLHCCYDNDTFSTYFWGPTKPPVPLCSRTMCYDKFSNTIWKNPKSGPCHFGCTERGYMYRWQHDVHKSHSTKLGDRYRLQALQRHLESVIHRSSKATNKKYNRYERAHILWAAGFQAAWRSNYNAYLKVT